MPDPNVRRRKYETYVAMIKNSVGTKMFRNMFVEFLDSEVQKDIYEDGVLSCSAYVSSLLTLNLYIARPHAEVPSVIPDMIKSGWVKTDTPSIGDVVHYAGSERSPDIDHLGFMIEGDNVISNSSTNGFPIVHHKTYNDTRKIIAYYTRDYETDVW